MNLAFPCLRAALLAALPALTVAASAHAQAQAPADAQAENRWEARGPNPEALLGAPKALDDPYRSAYDTPGQVGAALRNTQRVPRGALPNDAYAAPAVRGKGKGKAPPGLPGNEGAREAKVGAADPGAQTPMGSALSIYHGPGDVGKAVGQVYKMPW